MSARKILVVTYYWPPSGGSGVQRWLKFVKYLDRKGYETFVLTPENPSFTISDPSLEKDVPAATEVMRLPIWEPYSVFFGLSKMFGGKKPGASDMISSEKKSVFKKVSSWIRGNFFIPDPRVFWVKPAVTFLNDFIASNQIDTIITTGPPHSIHLIGLKLKKKNSALKWIADFRDPWSEWDLLDTLSLSSWARRRHQKLEKRVLQNADRVITIAPFHVRRFAELGGRPVDLITNGYDEEDFSGIERVRTKKFTIRHVGIVDELRDPRPVMLALKSLCESNSAIASNTEVEFIGNVNSLFKDFVVQDPVLKGIVRFVPNMPHRELLKLYGQTDVQLLILAHTAIAPGNLPGKFFEYLASGNTILAIGPVEGDAAEILKETNAGLIFDRQDQEGIADSLLSLFDLWKNNRPSNEKSGAEYSRRVLTDKLAKVIESLFQS